MATMTTCDFRAGQQTDHVATWDVSIKTLTGSEVRTADRKDSCGTHLADAVAHAAEASSKHQNFLRIELTPLEP